MRKIILTSLMLCSTFAFSQEIKYGAQAGLNISSLRGNYPANPDEYTTIDKKSIVGFNIGGFLEYQINEKFSIQPELLISLQGNKIVTKEEFYDSLYDETYKESFTQRPKLTYLNLPIMLKYKVLEKLSIEFGPQIGYLISAKSKWEYENANDPSENESIEVDMINNNTYTFGGSTFEYTGKLNRLDFSLNLGSSYDLTENVFVQARYNLGLSVLDKNSTAGTSSDSWDLKNSVIQISAGYKF